MPHLIYRNVNEAFHSMIRNIDSGCVNTYQTNSRNGPVTKCVSPVTITYLNPRQRVLFNHERDCNPFFHLYEAMWMLAGRNDVESVAWYASNMRNYTDDGEIFNGAYGHRWRHTFNLFGRDRANQIEELIDHLSDHPESRRAVLQMWSPYSDLPKVDNRRGSYSKDVCCNLSAVFRIRPVTHMGPEGQTDETFHLDMTVFNRSNDLVWGMFGANVVHFSYLQEYVANRLGVRVGQYHQVTSDLHVYHSNWEPERWLGAEGDGESYGGSIKPYDKPLVANPVRFEEELQAYVRDFTGPGTGREVGGGWTEPFFREVAIPMSLAFSAHKRREYDVALHFLEQVEASDWSVAGANWIMKRCDNYLTKLAMKGNQ